MLRRSDLSSYHLAGETEHYYITALLHVALQNFDKYSELQDLVSFFHFSSPQTGALVAELTALVAGSSFDAPKSKQGLISSVRAV